MGALRWALVIAVTALSTSAMLHFWGPRPGAHTDASAARYWCPMHHQVRSDRPGTCPICHMALVPIDDAPAQPDTHAHDTPDGGVAGVVPVTLTLDRVQLGGVASSPVREADDGAGITAPAVVEAPERAVVEVHVRAPGFVEEAPVRETGVRVSRGQTLARVYLPQALQTQQELLAATRFHAGSGPAAPHAMETISAPADLIAAARQNLSLLGMDPSDVDAVLRRGEPMRAFPLRAPIGGYVTRRAAVPGAYVTPETTLYEITDLGRVWVIASVDAEDVSRLHRGTVATFTPDEGAPVSARVALIEPAVSLESRTARVRLELPNPGLALRPGQWGRARFDTPPVANAPRELVVPRDAVIDTGDARYVFVDRGAGRYDPRAVTLGPRRGDDVVITRGLSRGERVVTRGAFMLDSESRLRASLTEAPAAPVDGGRP
ncbi:MAG: efflux RND transporter periplasmic adaptor subunit [Polyangiales bacterium]